MSLDLNTFPFSECNIQEKSNFNMMSENKWVTAYVFLSLIGVVIR